MRRFGETEQSKTHLSDVSASRFEEGVLAAEVAAGDDTGATDERGTLVISAGFFC